jgi:hypothetical protein
MSATHPAQPRQEVKARHAASPAGWHRWRPRLAWGLSIVGAALFVAGNIGANGRIRSPAGSIPTTSTRSSEARDWLAIVGLMWTTGDRK